MMTTRNEMNWMPDPIDPGHTLLPDCWCEPHISVWRDINGGIMYFIAHQNHDHGHYAEIARKRRVYRNDVTKLLDEIKV